MEPESKDSSRISEEAILDSLFYACDAQNSGFVPVSRLIEYLRSAIAVDSSDNNNLEFADNLDDLSLILDPDGQDVHIDIATYQAGITEWIEDIRKRSLASSDEEFFSPVSINCASPTFEPAQEISQLHVTSTPNLSSDSVEGIGGDSPTKNDCDRAAEMMSTIESLQLNNKRLLEQQSVIQSQMEQAEEGNSQLNNEIQALKKQLQSLQGTAAKCKELETENSELRQSVAESEEKINDLNKNSSLLFKEKQNLEACIEQLQSKLISLQVQLETLQDERRALSEALSVQKQVNMKLEELQNAKEDLVQESSSKTDYLSSVINELSLANEDLKTEKNKLQEAVADLNDELVRLRKGDSSDFTSPIRTPYQTSTPYRKPFSLKQELQEQLKSDSKGLPSPMVGTSMRSEGLDLSGSFLSGGADQSWLSSVSSDPANTSLEKYSIIASQVANEFKEKKEKALRQIEELANLEKSPEMKEKQKVLKVQLNQEVDQFAEKVNLLCLKKKNAEKRSAKLLVAIRKLKEESQLMQEERDKAYQKLGNMSLNTDHLDTRVNELQQELQKEKTKVSEMADKLQTLEKELNAANTRLMSLRDEKEALGKTLSSNIEEKQALEKRLEEITRSHSLLDEQQSHQLLRIKELENELARASSNLAIEQDRVAALEESLQLSVNKNSTEMQEIIDLIPAYDNELINKSKMSPRSSSPRVTGHAVKSRLQEFLNRMEAMTSAKDEKRDSPDGIAAVDALDTSFTEASLPVPRLPSPPLSSVSSQSPDHSFQYPGEPDIQTLDVTAEVLLESVPERDLKSTGSQTDLTLDSLEAMTSEKKNDQSPEEPKLLSLWRRKLSPSSYSPDEINYLQDDDTPGIDGSLNSSHFVDGVGLHVSPPPNEKEIEKQFKTLILAFQTDQLTLKKRLDVQARSRDIAEKNMDKELKNLSAQMKDLEEKYMRTRELQQIASSLKSQVDVLRHSAQRLCLVAQQYGSVQQESRMWSGIEVMISHAENVNRRLQRVKEDLDEFRKKERLHSDDSDTGESNSPQLSNGPTRIGGYREEDKIEESELETSNKDNRNSLVNFVMAIHNTSQRAKQVLNNFRRRTIDISSLSTTQEEPIESPQDSRTPSIDEDKESSDERDSEGAEGEVPRVVSRNIPEEPRIKKRGICRRFCGALFRFIFFVLLVLFLAIATIITLNEYTPYKLQREHIPISILRLLDPVAVLVHPRRPPV